MMQQLQAWMEKYDAMSLRERVLVFVAAVAGVALVSHALLIDPLAIKKRRLTRELEEVRLAIKNKESEIKTQEAQSDPDAVKRSYRDALRKQIVEIEDRMRGLQKGLVQPQKMARLLEQMLTRNQRLQLVSLRTLPVKRFENPALASAQKPAEGQAAKAPAQPEKNIYQHSYEITVQGGYGDVHDYLVQLEKLSWQMFWGRIAMDAERYPRLTVTLTVHTLSLDKAWLIV